MDVSATIDEAQRKLASGKDKDAARLLTDAAYGTHDVELEKRILSIATEGRAKSGFLNKGRWDEIIRVAELRAKNGQSSNGQA